MEYDGWRRGTSGRGGAGDRGYFVNLRDDAGDVGDLMVATVSGGWFPDSDTSALLAVELFDFLRLRRLAVSSL